MKTIHSQLQTTELKTIFSGHSAIPKNELRNFYRTHAQNFTEQFFRRILYALEKEQVFVPIGAGMYKFKEQEANRKGKYSYSPSKKLSSAHQTLQKAFLYLDYLCWETSLLHEFMIQQPRQNLIIIEAEKDACESVFNGLREKYHGKVFLDPDRSIIEKYILPQADPMIVIPLISQSPRMTNSSIPFPKLEKILVDIFVNEDIFFPFQGRELSNIYKNAFAAYWVNERTMFRYASRRTANARLRKFIQRKTKIQLVLHQESSQ
jgi:hypothetical protein